MTEFRVLWMRSEVPAIIDGFSRKIMGLKVFSGSPTIAAIVDLIDTSIGTTVDPKYIVTDRGGQFQRVFRRAPPDRYIQHDHGRCRT